MQVFKYFCICRWSQLSPGEAFTSGGFVPSVMFLLAIKVSILCVFFANKFAYVEKKQ